MLKVGLSYTEDADLKGSRPCCYRSGWELQLRFPRNSRLECIWRQPESICKNNELDIVQTLKIFLIEPLALVRRFLFHCESGIECWHYRPGHRHRMDRLALPSGFLSEKLWLNEFRVISNFGYLSTSLLSCFRPSRFATWFWGKSLLFATNFRNVWETLFIFSKDSLPKSTVSAKRGHWSDLIESTWPADWPVFAWISLLDSFTGQFRVTLIESAF